MGLTKEDKAFITEAVELGVEKKAEKFWVEAEQHYNDHQTLKALREFLDTSRTTITRTIIGVFVVGMMGLIFLGIQMKLGK